MDWRRELDELHEFFEGWYLGRIDSLDRADQVFAADFVHVGPDGAEHDRSTIIAMIEAGHAHTSSLSITLSDHRLLADSGDTVVATCVEHHRLTDRANARRLSVVFRREPSAPNGLHWRWVQETWIPDAE